MRECVFTPERSAGKKRKSRDWGEAASGSLDQIQTPALTERHSDMELPSDNLPSGKERIESNDISTDGRNHKDPVDFDHGHPSVPPEPSLTRSVMSKVVSSGNDALSLLFEAAVQQDTGGILSEKPSRGRYERNPEDGPMLHTSRALGADLGMYRGTTSSTDIYEIWQMCKFVKVGWMTPAQAIAYLDL